MDTNEIRNDRQVAMDVLHSTTAALAEIIDAHETAILQARPFEGKWTANEILGHLVDHEVVVSCRLRTLRFETDPWVGHYDQDRWVEVQGYNVADPSVIVPRFAYLRTLNLEQYESLSTLEWMVTKPVPDGTGSTSLDQLVRRHAEHDRHHLEQLRRFLNVLDVKTAPV